MDGFINILKPPGMTSHDVISWLRGLFRYRRIGHAGTLDPNVSGVLPVALGKGTRLLEYFLNSDKGYRCEIVLGIVTATQDLDGEVMERNPVLSEQLRRFPLLLQEFTGEIVQIPPMVSAIRFQGQRLYELARQGVDVERPPRRVIISRLELLETNFEQLPYTALFDVECSKGTYIRTLCHDLGQRLGCGASLSFLIRTHTGGFRLEDAWTLEEIQANWEKGSKDFLLPLAEVLPFAAVLVKGDWLSTVLQGGRIPLEATTHDFIPLEKQIVQVLDTKGLIAIAEILSRNQQHFLQPRKVLR